MDEPAVEQPLLVPHSHDENAVSVVSTEDKRLLRLAMPLVASFIPRNAVQVVSVMFVGHLGELPLAGASLASSVANVTGFSLLSGMASVLDTLCGEAFGAGQYGLLGVYKQCARLRPRRACAELVLLLGQDTDVAAEAGAYARWLIPSLAVFVPLTCHTRFLQAQSIVVPVMASSGVTAVTHVALVYTAGMGSKGAALSIAISYTTNLVILALCWRLHRSPSDPREGQQPPAKEE